MSDERPRHNPNAHTPASLDYSAQRGRRIRWHTSVDHFDAEYDMFADDDRQPIHIPVTLPGVKP